VAYGAGPIDVSLASGSNNTTDTVCCC
jgi:hypothetical protein